MIGGAQLTGGEGQNVGLGSFVKQGLQGLLSKPQAAADFMSATQGLARNNHMALIYRGPNEFRSHTFNFSFWPKDKDETRIVQEIITDFKKGSTPRLAGLTKDATDITKLRAPYFAAPRHWEIKFCMGGRGTARTEGENPYLFKIGRSVITSMTINHDPDNVIGFHPDGSPVHSTLAITFQEIEYVISEDKVDVGFNKMIADAKEQEMNLDTASEETP